VSSDCKYISVSVSHVQDTVAQLCLSPSVAETLTCGLVTPSALSCMLAFRMKWWVNLFYLHLNDLGPTSTWGSDVRATKCMLWLWVSVTQTLVASHRVSCLKAAWRLHFHSASFKRTHFIFHCFRSSHTAAVLSDITCIVIMERLWVTVEGGWIGDSLHLLNTYRSP
jgi:hypothetical protein